ncbi:unnamed protein product [Hermetia illucens]|uniref:Uncharacterized protein n=1 Tax=Hermetia illucens TaxID=343691 RepID=A0A7R8UNT9_HERIL|nr:unnamed protein product [Hermetia illucens]
MVWREPTSHAEDCYFCMTAVSGFSQKSKHTITYPNIPSEIRPVEHSNLLPVPTPTENCNLDSEESKTEQNALSPEEDVPHSCQDKDFTPIDLDEPKLLTQELNDLVRNLDPFKPNNIDYH